MNIEHLSYFCELYRTLNYTTAARNFFITRQALRQAIQMLEQTYHVRLIENNHNHLSVTPAGRMLYEKAQSVLHTYSELNDAMRSFIASDSALRIGVTRSITPFYAPEVLAAVNHFTGSYSGIPVRISLLSTDEIGELLSEGELDAGILVELFSKSDPLGTDQFVMPTICHTYPSFQRTILRQDILTIMLSAFHPLAQKERLSLKDLKGQTLMVMGQPDLYFYPLYQAICRENIEVDWKTVPDFYEVCYRILQGNCLSIDRAEATLFTETAIDRNLPLENGRFILSCNLLTPFSEKATLQAFRRAIVEELKIPFHS